MADEHTGLIRAPLLLCKCLGLFLKKKPQKALKPFYSSLFLKDCGSKGFLLVSQANLSRQHRPWGSSGASLPTMWVWREVARVSSSSQFPRHSHIGS